MASQETDRRLCPFHSDSGGIALSELPLIVRVGDRLRIARAVEQVEASVMTARDLDEARGMVLTFLAVLSAATLESGAPRPRHTVQLEAARALDLESDRAAVCRIGRRYFQQTVPWLFEERADRDTIVVELALVYVKRHFAKAVTAESVARVVGLSGSHFRHLFRKVTGQSFHQYLIALRLETARQLLKEDGLSLTEVAESVGYQRLSHFSRAFSERFSASPSEVRSASEEANHHRSK